MIAFYAVKGSAPKELANRLVVVVAARMSKEGNASSVVNMHRYFVDYREMLIALAEEFHLIKIS